MAMEWLGRVMAATAGKAFDPKAAPGGAEKGKEALAAYRGFACGVRYAEAVWSLKPSPRDIL